MTEPVQNEKPCLVQTPQGFSVSYKNKFLYSKYSPQKAICTTVQNLNILPGTLFLCCSPVLPYGLKELIARLDDSSFCLLCEFDSTLSEFSSSQNDFLEIERMKKAARLSLPELQALPSILHKPSYTTVSGAQLLPAGSFKRIVRIDFSAGVQLHAPLYDELTRACTASIMTFWANRMTLVKFGRKYSQDFFKNLKLLPSTTPISYYFGKITKPIIVFGAGESTDKGINEIKEQKDSFFILCADTALQPLIENKIYPDGVFVEEAQNIIKKAFIGTKNTKTKVFAGLSAVPNLNRIVPEKQISFFTTLYTKAMFLENLSKEGLLPPSNEPFGSVGLTAVYYALKFRFSEEVPVFLYGLDFSYSKGRTHAKGTMAHKARLIMQNRLLPVANYSASFNPQVFKITGKDGSNFYTTRTLNNYAELFRGYFSGTKNLYDSADCGINLGLPQKKPEVCNTTQNIDLQNKLEKSNSTAAFFESEKQTLEKLRDVLSGKLPLPPEEQQDFITKTAACREYLYLHFADGISFKYETSLLKRIRTDIDFFLKIF